MRIIWGPLFRPGQRNNLHIVTPATRPGVFNRGGPETLNYLGPLDGEVFLK
jgi:hypothetical protein